MAGPRGDEAEALVLLGALRVDGAERAADGVFNLVYGELKALARGQLAREAPGHTLQPTALVHEAYLRLVREGGEKWADPAYFFAVAARAMRRILIEHARREGRPKRGGDRRRLPLDAVDAAAPADDADWLALDDLLTHLAKVDERAARVVELRVFAGLEVAGAARAMGVSEATVKRDWVYARAWLRDRWDGDTRTNGHGH